jgi:hypothetical protein
MLYVVQRAKMPLTECSAVEAYLFWEQVVVGSNPAIPTSASFKNKYSVWQGYFLSVSNVLRNAIITFIS